MKRWFAFSLAFVCIVGLAGCSSEMTLAIAEASKIELRSGTNGTTVEVTGEEDIQYITDNINGLGFRKGKSSKDFSGWRYSLKWYNSENALIEELVVMSEYQIDYKNHFYASMDADAEIDISFLDTLLNH